MTTKTDSDTVIFIDDNKKQYEKIQSQYAENTKEINKLSDNKDKLIKQLKEKEELLSKLETKEPEVPEQIENIKAQLVTIETDLITRKELSTDLMKNMFKFKNNTT